ncbi:TRI12-domain-containing protein [Pyrenochaeta sp. DS3sAY3a]|nr:TRI12-domain-containing protein [Pyrenochaeta sp. DS3sAY3a]
MEKPDHQEDRSTAHKREDAIEDVVEITDRTPYKDLNFMGTYLACALATTASYGGYVMPATSLALINADIGPSPNITWVALSWTLTLAVGYTLVGRFSDLFGRRWFFTGSSALALIGFGATAQSINQLIGANVLIGLAAASQLSFTYVLGELVPIKDRFAVFCGLFIISFPVAGLGPYLSRLFIAHTGPGWRWNYYFSIIINGIATILWFLCYHPPAFEHLHKNRSKWQELKDIDITGIILFTGGLLLFLMGLSWGGQLYEWSSAHVIATMVVGFIMLVAFVLWELYAPLSRPLVPMHLFKSWDFNVIVIMTSVGGMLYYSLNVIFPAMVGALFTTDVVYGGLLSSAVGGGTCLGQFLGCLIATPGGHIRHKMIFVSAMMMAFIGGMAGAGQNQAVASALVVLGSVSVGLLESIGNGIVTIILEDQTKMGAAVGVYGSIRSAAGVLATAIYTTIL